MADDTFMKPQVIFGKWVKVDTLSGIVYIPLDHVSYPDVAGVASFIPPEDITDGSESISVIEGWGARLSAPGYMDCTEWCVYTTEYFAWTKFCAMYDLDVEIPAHVKP